MASDFMTVVTLAISIGVSTTTKAHNQKTDEFGYSLILRCAKRL